MILLSLILLFFGKQGVGATYEDCAGLQAVNAKWFYNWSVTPPLCETCGGTGALVAKVDSEDLPSGLVWQYVCPDCGGEG